MANLGISNASYYTDRFIHKINKEVDNALINYPPLEKI